MEPSALSPNTLTPVSHSSKSSDNAIALLATSPPNLMVAGQRDALTSLVPTASGHSYRPSLPGPCHRAEPVRSPVTIKATSDMTIVLP